VAGSVIEREPVPRRVRGVKLDLGCGARRKEGYVGLDIARAAGVDVVCDLARDGLPVADGCVAEVFCSHLFEHIPHGDGPVDLFVALMNECWRVLAPGGRLEAYVPEMTCPGAFADPTHRRFFNHYSFLYFGYYEKEEQSMLEYGRLYGFTGQFRIERFVRNRYNDFLTELGAILIKEDVP
jgi:SAM-dependent methyltransferase